MTKITVLDGTLYQWDTGRKIQIVPDVGTSVSEVHFSYPLAPDALIAVAEAVDGVTTATVPNAALRVSGTITVYVAVVTADGRRTVHSKNLFVAGRAKPEDYDETATDDTGLYILEDESGARLYAVLVDEETVVDATANDIRLGVTAVTEDGITEGTKEIPAYHTTEGVQGVPAGGEAVIKILGRYDYTKMQAILCLFNTSLANSVAADKVCINDNVYAVSSTDVLSSVTIDHENSTIKLGIVNESDKPLVIRYFSYKEEA